MRPMLLRLAFLISAFLTATVHADIPSFRISEIYSNIDGSIQFVELTETEGRNGQRHFAGLKLTTTHDGVVKEFTFDADLETDETAFISITVASVRGGNILPVQSGSFYYCCHAPTYRAGPLFVPTERGMVDFAGVDRVAYDALPANGTDAIDRDGNAVRATVSTVRRCLTASACTGGRMQLADQYHYARAVEYYHAGLDHYFLTAAAADIDALDSGRTPGWRRTGASFVIGGGSGSYPGMAQPVCRFRIPPELGDSHFLSASPAECSAVAERFPALAKESGAAFHVALPDMASGACPPDLDFNGSGAALHPVYRVWNARADSNHRYTTSRELRDEMVAKGQVAEGYGPDRVAFCVP